MDVSLTTTLDKLRDRMAACAGGATPDLILTQTDCMALLSAYREIAELVRDISSPTRSRSATRSKAQRINGILNHLLTKKLPSKPYGFETSVDVERQAIDGKHDLEGQG